MVSLLTTYWNICARKRVDRVSNGIDTADALSGAKLASAGYVSQGQKNRRLQLHNPDENVAFDNTSKL